MSPLQYAYGYSYNCAVSACVLCYVSFVFTRCPNVFKLKSSVYVVEAEGAFRWGTSKLGGLKHHPVFCTLYTRVIMMIASVFVIIHYYHVRQRTRHIREYQMRNDNVFMT
jgi:hypothetical protein